jgi:RNA polymerase subunit RPABC4/transcription elongation factor Spt4
MDGMAFTKTRVLMGINHEKPVTLSAYGGAIIKAHPVPDVGLTEIQSRLGYGIFDAIESLTAMGLNEQEIDALMENENKSDTIAKISQLKLPAPLFKYMAELCKKGIVPTPDPECPKCKGLKLPANTICPACDTRDLVDQFIGFSTLEIGAVILGMSMGDWAGTEAFFAAKTAVSGQESSP